MYQYFSQSVPFGAAWFKQFCNLHSGQWARVFLGVQACKRVHTPLHALCTLQAESVQRACTRSRGRHPPPPFRLLPRQRGRPVDDLLREVAAHIVLTAEPAMQRGKMPQSASLTSRADMQVRGYAVVMHGSDMKDLRISETRRAASSGFAE